MVPVTALSLISPISGTCWQSSEHSSVFVTGECPRECGSSTLEQGSISNKALEHQGLGESEDPGQPQAQGMCAAIPGAELGWC